MHFRRTLLLLALASIPFASPADAATRDEVFAKAEADRTQARPEAAIVGYSSLLRGSPRDGHVLSRRASSLHALGRHREAVLDQCRADLVFAQAKQQNRDRAIVLCNRSNSALAEGDIPGAFADALCARKLDEGYVWVYVRLAEVFHAVGMSNQVALYQKKVRSLDASLQLNFSAEEAARNARQQVQPDDAYDDSKDFEAAYKLEVAKKYEEALKGYEAILRKAPLNSSAWGNRGNVLRNLGRTEESAISHSRAVSVATAFGEKAETVARHHANRISSWIALQEADYALIDAEFANQVAPSYAWAWRQAASAWYEFGDLTEARAKWAQAQKLDPNTKEPRFTEEKAAANAVLRRARSGDSEAVGLLFTAAREEKTGMFVSNRSRAVLIQFLDEQLRLDPRNLELLVQRAEAEDIPSVGIRFGSSEKALELIEVPLKLSPNHGRALLVRGLLRLDYVGEGNEALMKLGYADLDKAIAAGAGNATAYSRRSMLRVQENNHAAAVADLTAAIRLTPDDVTLYSQRADSLEKLGRWEEAIADHSKCVSLEPRKANRLADRAEAYAGAKQWQKSLADYAAAIVLSPKDADLYLGRAATHRLSGNREAALLDHRRARALDPLLPELKADFSNAAEIEALRHDLKHAFSRVSKATDDLSEAAAEMLKAKRRMERAEARLRRQVAGDDRSPEQVLKDFDEASEAGELEAQDWRERAHALLRLKRHDEALHALDQCILLQDDHAGVRDQRGRLHEAKGNYDAAFADYDRAIALSPKVAEFHLDRGDIWWERKDFAKAHADYAEAVALDPKDGANWYKRGNALFRLGRFAEAVADYDRALELRPDLGNARKNREIARSRLTGG